MKSFNYYYIQERINDLETRLEALQEEYELKEMGLQEEGLTEDEIEDGLYELYEEIEDVKDSLSYWNEVE